jgi:glycosyltransferase involved in cell wall biosynthesis
VTGDDLTIVIPLWRRTANIGRVYESAWAATPDAQILFVVSQGDAEVVDVVEELTGSEYLLTDGPGGEAGDYARKINAGYRETDREWLFTGADDLLFHPGWYESARAHAAIDTGVIGTVDLCNGRTSLGEHSTHSLVARWYADFGGSMDADHMIYHEGYVHEYCDDELVQTAMMRGAYAHAFDAVVEHKHMLIDATLDDPVYRHGRRFTRLSRRLFLRRKFLWGNLS